MYYLTVGKRTTRKNQTLPTVVKGVHTKVIKQALSSQESDPLLQHDSGQREIACSVSASTPAVSSMLPSSVSASIPAQDFSPALPVRPNPQEIRESLPMQSHKSLVSSPPMQSHRGPVSSSNTAQHPREPPPVILRNFKKDKEHKFIVLHLNVLCLVCSPLKGVASVGHRSATVCGESISTKKLTWKGQETPPLWGWSTLRACRKAFCDQVACQGWASSAIRKDSSG